MSLTLRVLLLILSIVSAFWILFKIRRLKVKMEDAIFWILFAVILCILGLFPEITYWLTNKVGMISPSNFIYLVVLMLLLEKVFTLSIIVSQLEDKISVLSAEIALRDHAMRDKTEKLENALDIQKSQDTETALDPQKSLNIKTTLDSQKSQNTEVALDLQKSVDKTSSLDV